MQYIYFIHELKETLYGFEYIISPFHLLLNPFFYLFCFFFFIIIILPIQFNSIFKYFLAYIILIKDKFMRDKRKIGDSILQYCSIGFLNVFIREKRKIGDSLLQYCSIGFQGVFMRDKLKIGDSILYYCSIGFIDVYILL